MNPLLQSILEGVLFMVGCTVMCSALWLALMHVCHVITKYTGREEREE